MLRSLTCKFLVVAAPALATSERHRQDIALKDIGRCINCACSLMLIFSRLVVLEIPSGSMSGSRTEDVLESLRTLCWARIVPLGFENFEFNNGSNADHASRDDDDSDEGDDP
ncbi:hypothetical protein MLD38_035308 [Melastoma candidum]|uniref:Uncharacterized protein n=1 Tax=Melastoma candidum TaxID=119954 RepID=A0ACB9MDW8_9MYRT|nr:hypothetical protein MLD38_035308 [Melastoma candidum]